MKQGQGLWLPEHQEHLEPNHGFQWDTCSLNICLSGNGAVEWSCMFDGACGQHFNTWELCECRERKDSQKQDLSLRRGAKQVVQTGTERKIQQMTAQGIMPKGIMEGAPTIPANPHTLHITTENPFLTCIILVNTLTSPVKTISDVYSTKPE